MVHQGLPNPPSHLVQMHRAKGLQGLARPHSPNPPLHLVQLHLHRLLLPLAQLHPQQDLLAPQEQVRLGHRLLEGAPLLLVRSPPIHLGHQQWHLAKVPVQHQHLVQPQLPQPPLPLGLLLHLGHPQPLLRLGHLQRPHLLLGVVRQGVQCRRAAGKYRLGVTEGSLVR